MNFIPVKLNEPKTSFNYFEDNQVLTAEQLNKVVQYFDYQERITRARLIGVGIVCGLHIVFERNAITVTKGVGVTSDGDMMILETDKTLISAQLLNDQKANYAPFQKLRDANGALRIWELTEVADAGDSDDLTPLSSFFDNRNRPQDYVILAYLSQHLHDTDQCSSDECENKGLVHVSDLKFLAVTKADYDLINDESACCGDTYFSMPELSVPRVLLNERDNIFSYADFQAAYRKQIEAGAAALKEPLTFAVAAARTLSACMMESGVIKSNPQLATMFSAAVVTDRAGASVDLHAQLMNKLTPFLNSNTVNGIQYVYDCIKEIADAYYEYKEQLFVLCHGCCYDAAAFPKHLALGLLAADITVTPCKYRDCFIESPVLNHKDDQLREAIMLFMRLLQMVRSFDIRTGAGVSIKITPSASIAGNLSNRAIPYYYNASSLLANWNPGKTFRRKEKTNLGYDGDQYSNLDFVKEPLKFNIDAYEFFRIEGHVGKTYDDAYRAIERLRQQFDLPFEITAVQLQKERRTIVPPKIRKKNWYDLLLEREKFGWSHRLDHVKDYSDRVVTTLPTAEELSKPEFRKMYNTSRFQDPVQAKTNVEAKKSEIQNNLTAAKTMLASFKPTAENEQPAPDFVSTHQQLTSISLSLSKSAKLLTETALLSPVSTIGILDQPYIIDWIGSIIINTENKIKDGYVFSNFLKQNPSMMHNAGVCRGGTFILVYDIQAREKIVIGDFYLPYIAKEDLVDTEVDPVKVPLKPYLPVDVGLVKDFVKVPFLNEDILGIKDRFDLFVKDEFTGVKGKVDGVTHLINEVNKDVINVREGVAKNMETMANSYQKTFGSITESYNSFLGDVVKLGDKRVPGAVAGGVEGLLGLNADAFTNLSPDRINLVREKIKEITTRLR
ncbi:MAG TPA: hypothetical protein VFV46_04090 [Lacibacter sp.]|nr:hypothetical protein [Lacibacter sp.]